MNVLTIAPQYHTFVKGPVDAIAARVDEMVVAVHYNVLTAVADVLPATPRVDHIRRYTKRRLSDETQRPNNLRREWVPLFYLRPDGRNPKLGLMIADGILKQIRRSGGKVDIVHSHFLWPSGGAGAIVSDQLGVPHVVTGHGFDVYDLPYRHPSWRRIVCQVLDAADHVTTVSRSNMTHIRSLTTTPATVIPNGVDLNLFRPLDRDEARRRLGMPTSGRLVLSVGALREIKGHGCLIEAMSRVVKALPDARCAIIGDGEMRASLQAQIHQAGLAEVVKLLGSRDHSAIPVWMSASDVFVLPSIRESFGVVQIEAMACGRPVVATENGGSEEIVNSQDHGLLCSVGDPDDMAEKIIAAFGTTWDSGKIRERAAQFTWARVGEQYVELYGKLRTNQSAKTSRGQIG